MTDKAHAYEKLSKAVAALEELGLDVEKADVGEAIRASEQPQSMMEALTHPNKSGDDEVTVIEVIAAVPEPTMDESEAVDVEVEGGDE